MISGRRRKLRYFVDEEGGVEMARDGVRGKKSTDLVVYVINEATKLLKGTSVRGGAFHSTSRHALKL